jgi:uncharacterized iron-regulated membrane protein
MRRHPLLLWHRWFGLIAALWLFVMGATGSVLVFYQEIDDALNRDMFTASAGPARPIAQIAAAAASAHPGFSASYVDLPNSSGEVARVFLAPLPGTVPAGAHSPVWEALVDPATARVLGERDRESLDLSRRNIIPFLYHFHYSLHLGPWMQWFLGLVALVWLIDHLIAAALSFPTAARWRESFRIRRGVSGHKRAFDLHRAVGLWLLPVTLVLAVSGVYFNLDDEFRAVVSAVSPVSKRLDETRVALPQPLASPAISFDQAIARAGAARVDGVAYNAAKRLYWLRAFDPRDIDPYGRRWIFVDATSGAVIEDRHATEGTAGDVVMAWQFPLHSGKAFGWWGRIAIFCAGIATCSFVVTGLILYLRKRRARAARRPRPALAYPLGDLQPAE